MKRCTFVMALAVSLALIAACGKKDDKSSEGKSSDKKAGASVVASCDQRDAVGAFKTCNEYFGTNWTAKEVEAQCVGNKKFIAGACPKQGVVASCKMYAGTPSELVTRYYDKADKAKAACGRLKGQLQ